MEGIVLTSGVSGSVYGGGLAVDEMLRWPAARCFTCWLACRFRYHGIRREGRVVLSALGMGGMVYCLFFTFLFSLSSGVSWRIILDVC